MPATMNTAITAEAMGRLKAIAVEDDTDMPRQRAMPDVAGEPPAVEVVEESPHETTPSFITALC
jgi:hypothetical protein